MKKLVLLSVVASTMIMAGGDIAPVEAVVVPVAASAWDFSGQAVVYYQTIGQDSNDLFAQESSAADVGLQLKAVNNDVFAGIGAGFTVNGLSTLNLENSVVSGVMQLTGNPVAGNDIDDITDGGWIAEAYLTYGMGNTSIKAGRQTLPKSLSPFAYSEDWNVFENTFDAILLVNTDITNTTLVGAWIAGNNVNSMMMTNLTDFNSLNDDRGVYMLTAQNKSFENLTLTGSYYYGSEFITADDINILWGDAQYAASSFNVGVQGGTVMHDAMTDDIVAFGAKVGTTLAGINVAAAYSNVNDGGVAASVNEGGLPFAFGMFNIGGTTSALYTTTLVDQLFTSSLMTFDTDKYVINGNIDALGGNISALYAYTDMNSFNGSVNEFDLSYTTNLTDNFGIGATYAYINADINVEDVLVADEDMNVVRVVARYKF
ncbi:hypothetical protein [Sulfurovum sp.]|uniref:hypothetical protein n=1 Tax=Sulfurovum sp. TaxID=1969726 RepID=UPI002867E28B|nr:hypothetical protein [Sulfurovum sp.]